MITAASAVAETVEYLPFSRVELLALKRFYAGDSVRVIRQQLCDPWPVVARHRCLPRSLRDHLLQSMENL